MLRCVVICARKHAPAAPWGASRTLLWHVSSTVLCVLCGWQAHAPGALEIAKALLADAAKRCADDIRWGCLLFMC